MLSNDEIKKRLIGGKGTKEGAKKNKYIDYIKNYKKSKDIINVKLEEKPKEIKPTLYYMEELKKKLEKRGKIQGSGYWKKEGKKCYTIKTGKKPGVKCYKPRGKGFNPRRVFENYEKLELIPPRISNTYISAPEADEFKNIVNNMTDAEVNETLAGLSTIPEAPPLIENEIKQIVDNMSDAQVNKTLSELSSIPIAPPLSTIPEAPPLIENAIVESVNNLSNKEVNELNKKIDEGKITKKDEEKLNIDSGLLDEIKKGIKLKPTTIKEKEKTKEDLYLEQLKEAITAPKLKKPVERKPEVPAEEPEYMTRLLDEIKQARIKKGKPAVGTGMKGGCYSCDMKKLYENINKTIANMGSGEKFMGGRFKCHRCMTGLNKHALRMYSKKYQMMPYGRI